MLVLGMLDLIATVVQRRRSHAGIYTQAAAHGLRPVDPLKLSVPITLAGEVGQAVHAQCGQAAEALYRLAWIHRDLLGAARRLAAVLTSRPPR